MLQVFSTSAYALLDTGSMLSFMTPLFTLTFETLHEFLHDPIVVRTPLGENVRDYRVHKDYQIVVCSRTMCADLVELPMHDFNIILCMDWRYKSYAFMDCHSWVVEILFP